MSKELTRGPPELVLPFSSPFPVGRRGVISSFKWFLPAFPTRGWEGSQSAACGRSILFHETVPLKALSARASNPSSPSTSRPRTGTSANSSNVSSSTRGNRARFRRKWRARRGAAPSSPAAVICLCSTRSVWCSAPSCRRVSPCWGWRSCSGNTCASTYSGSLSPISLRWGEADPLAYYT